MLSLRKMYVIIANTKFDTPKPNSFDAHNSSVAKTTFLIACQKQKPIGTANKRVDKTDLSFHQSQAN
jgi:hypothetical protein